MNIRYLLPILALLLLSSCCAVCKEAPRASLKNTSWTMVELLGQPVELPADNKKLTLDFTADQVQGYDGCNQFSGSYEINEGRLIFGPMASTRRFCGEQINRIEQDFYQVLDDHTDHRVNKGILELLQGEKVQASFSAD